MNKKDLIEILSQCDGVLHAIDNMEISDCCATTVERFILNIKTIIFCTSEVFNDKL